MAKRLPLLVILSGASASGKTSMAKDLADELGLVLLAKDDLKEGLFDSLGRPSDLEESERLATASYVLIERIGRRVLEADAGLLVEGNFERGRSELSLGPLVARSRAAIVHCEIPPKKMARKIKQRVEGKKDRHPGHRDAAPHPEVVQQIEKPELLAERPDREPPNLDVPVLRVDRSKDDPPPIRRIASWVKRVTKG